MGRSKKKSRRSSKIKKEEDNYTENSFFAKRKSTKSGSTDRKKSVKRKSSTKKKVKKPQVKLTREERFAIMKKERRGTSLKGLDAFIVGATYTRRSIHDAWGGQRVSGISTPSTYPVIFLFTAYTLHMKAFTSGVYNDKWINENTFVYSGSGQNGDQTWTSYNMSIRDHKENGKRLFLFRKTKKSGVVQFEGEMEYTGHNTVMMPDSSGKNRKVFQFTLKAHSNSKLSADKFLIKTHRDSGLKDEEDEYVNSGASLDDDSQEDKEKVMFSSNKKPRAKRIHRFTSPTDPSPSENVEIKSEFDEDPENPNSTTRRTKFATYYSYRDFDDVIASLKRDREESTKDLPPAVKKARIN